MRKTKVRIFSRMGRTNWSTRALLYSHTKRPKPSLNSELNIFVFSLTAAVGREIFSNSFISFEVKLSLKRPKFAKKFCRPFCLFIEVGFRFPVPIRPFWWSNKALDRPLINQSNRVLLSQSTMLSTYQPIAGSVLKDIRTAALTYGSNGVRGPYEELRSKYFSALAKKSINKDLII